MKLLNTTTLELEEFFDGHAPKYAILSHRWLDGEVSFQEMQAGTAAKKTGYQKIANTCKQALRDGLGYAWVDTCCIDKSSSAELSESINSMYRWYGEAEVCYAFLSDVNVNEVNSPEEEDEFSKSVWFTRGWSLQELIAPSNVVFYNASWREIGTKASLRGAVAAVTQIDAAVLEQNPDLERYSLARRMSWASRRVTTRKEDLAYCLLGIFQVNMPMLYGEGDRAFLRLQQEIIKNSDDQSLFAWGSNSSGASSGVFARSPADFETCADIMVTRSRWNKKPFTVSNMGLSIHLPMIPWAMDTFLAALDCERGGRRLGIFLRMLPQEDRYARVTQDGEHTRFFEGWMSPKSTYRDIFIQQSLQGRAPPAERFYGFWIRTLLSSKGMVPLRSDREDSLTEVMTHNTWDGEARLAEIPKGDNGTAAAMFVREDGKSTVVKVGLDGTFNPMVQVGGGIFCTDVKGYSSYSFEARMLPSWMNAPQRSMYLHRGDRVHGYSTVAHPWKISVEEGPIPGTGKRGFIVDIERVGDREIRGGQHYGVVCDICEGDVYGSRYKCLVCEDFDLCENCKIREGPNHGHQFKELVYNDGKGSKVNRRKISL